MATRDHVVLFPFMAQGHITPFLSLANLIQERHRSFTVTLLSTPLNIAKLQLLLPAASRLRLHSLPFDGSHHGLPPNSENTDSLCPADVVRLQLASQSLEPHFEHFLQVARPAVIIADIFLGWTVLSARKIGGGVRHAAFTTCGAYGFMAFTSMWLHFPHKSTGDDEFHVPGFPPNFRLDRSQISPYLRSADDSEPLAAFVRRQIRLSLLESDFVLCNTVEEIDSFGLRLLRENTKLAVWPVGPLLPLEAKESYNRAGKKSGINLETCIQWLSRRSQGSLLYICFGSQNTISASQMTALAVGLELTQTPFIWVIRPPVGFDMNGEFKDEWLPEGFESRMRDRDQGILVRSWAPQLEILTHESTGAFLTHCGWNSVLESLSRGKPMVAWPLAAEQFYNAKMMTEELGVCAEIARGLERELEVDRVVTVIGMVMEGEEGREMRRKAAECKELIRDAMREEEGGSKGSSIKSVDNFILTAVSATRTEKEVI
ncbi:crocetin glucosyltransferase 3-like [Typha angustifolia]|uniref:crocetin glucosyltransferase 3-like n=1 Tax=Typha angustifolia TaxID=59011 RepID=UPI003C302A78